jgi:hypothetical protein
LRIKALAQMALVSTVVTEAGQIKIQVAELQGLDRYHVQRYLGSAVRVSRKAVWLKRDMGTHEWQVELVQVLEKLRSSEAQGSGGVGEQRSREDGRLETERSE